MAVQNLPASLIRPQKNLNTMQHLTQRILRTAVAAAFVVSAFAATAFTPWGGCVNGSGDLVKQKRDHAGFSSISISVPVTVRFKQGTTYSVEVEAEENLQEVLVTEIKGQTLKVTSAKNKCIGKTRL